MQRGAALLTAMVIVTLVATLAAAMVWQQWRAVRVEEIERGRMQAAWILSGGLDWARLILREDARNAGADHLGEPWAVPLAEARLSTFLAADKDSTDDSPDAFLSGTITDAQSRYNLRNLVDEDKVRAADLAILKRICEIAGVSTGVADRLATGLRDALRASTDVDGNPPLMPVSLNQLEWLQIDRESIRRLSPHVVLLPVRTPVNLNTAAREVIAATVEGLDLGSAERLLQVRQRTPFKNLDEVKAELPSNVTLSDGQV
ncbi:MAG: type II secretion system minor pseudopilin GspK, partial [Burkholderiaceae bacterium]|nr:type II secretion system minor pseudopilin GspK [Burkholderiaceae bacterium]